MSDGMSDGMSLDKEKWIHLVCFFIIFMSDGKIDTPLTH